MASEAPPAALARSWLDGYPVEATTGDLFRGAPASVADKWQAMALGMAALAQGDDASIHEQVSRQIRDLGMTFRVTGDENERDWALTPIPLIIGAGEWATVERGLIQRAELMERLAADIYGPQRLVAEGHLPAAVIAGSPFFARKMIGHGPQSGRYIYVYAVDLARGPQGQWRVLSDRVRLATGIGYALENRLAMSRTTDALLSESNVRRLADFFSHLREGIASDCQREQPRIALLTPGRFNQSYPEQAHLARYLGMPLVEGRDLTVTDDRLYVRTIGGPRRIDALWRWINTTALDPLTFDARSQLGVANLFDAATIGGLGIVNWPGVEVLESSALSAFLPRLCNILLGEQPILPTVATWWCGQNAEAHTVERYLDEMALVSAFGQPVDGITGWRPVEGARLGSADRAALFEAMSRRPMDYCGQEVVHLSTTPALIDGEIVPRPFTVRAFVTRTADGSWTVMPGGFARVSSVDELPTTLMGEGDLSADVWVVDDEQPDELMVALRAVPPMSRGGGILSSQAADNLFWFGRYMERAEMTVRVIRSILGSSIEVDGNSIRSGEVRRSLVLLLNNWGAIDYATLAQPFPVVCGRALAETNLAGGVTALVNRGRDVALVLRERFARDFWHIVSRPMPFIDPQRPQSMFSMTNGLVERFSALSGLTSENMVRGPAWRFLHLGRRLERAVLLCRMSRHLSQLRDQTDALGILLDLCDSQIVYRSRYFTGPVRDPVLDLVLLDPDNPRSLVFQLVQLTEHLGALPQLREDNIPEEPFRLSRAVTGEMLGATAAALTMDRLGEVETRLFEISEAISTRYFLQLDRPDLEGSLLA